LAPGSKRKRKNYTRGLYGRDILSDGAIIPRREKEEYRIEYLRRKRKSKKNATNWTPGEIKGNPFRSLERKRFEQLKEQRTEGKPEEWVSRNDRVWGTLRPTLGENSATP